MSYIELSPSPTGGTAATTTFAPAGNVAATDVQAAIVELDTEKVARAGDIMTGALSIASTNPTMVLNKSASGGYTILVGALAGSVRWQISPGNSVAESGSNAGSNFEITRHSDAGAYIDSPLQIIRATGNAALTQGIAAVGTTPGAQPGNGNALTGFEISGTSDATRGMLFHSYSGAAWNANWNRNSTGNVHTFTLSGGGWAGTINVTSATTTTYNTTSDANLKEDLKSFDAGNIIDNTEVYDFKWKDSSERAYGVIAQQAVDVYPLAVTHVEAASGREDAPDVAEWWGVDYSKYVPVLLQELKALRARVRELEGKVGAKPS